MNTTNFTNSFAYPDLFNPTSGKCNLYQDYQSILNRVGLLIQSYTGEEFMFPEFGSEFPDVLLSYNTTARIAKAKENITAAIIKFEPFVQPTMVHVEDKSEGNHLVLSVTLVLDKDFKQLAGTIDWSFDEQDGNL